MIAHGVPCFSFHELDTSLTDATKAYLDVFGRYYQDSLLSENKYVIELTPGVTDAEWERDTRLGFTRAKIVIRYLEKNHGIGMQNFKIRVHETVHTICVGFVVKERRSKGATRRERRKLKREGKLIDEDTYFRE